MNETFEPKIVVFACNWCTYAGADLAGSLRCAYPTNVCVVRLPCSGRVKPEFVLHALFRGADGVLIGGCHPGDCHYKSGNYYAHRRYNLLKSFLKILGVKEDRVRLEWISGSEGVKFAEVAKDFTERIRELGPSKIQPLPDGDWRELGRVIAGLGSADMVFWNESKSMIEVVRWFIDFVQKNSCGECVPCRVGTRRIQEFLDQYLQKGGSEDIKNLLKEFAEDIGYSSRCDLGRLAGKALKYLLACCSKDLEAYQEGKILFKVDAHPGWEKVMSV